jgi:hypothetical protein
MKLTLFKKPRPKNIGAVFTEPKLANKDEVFSNHSLMNEAYILFNAGSGGHKNKGELSTDLYYLAAQKIHQKTKYENFNSYSLVSYHRLILKLFCFVPLFKFARNFYPHRLYIAFAELNRSVSQLVSSHLWRAFSSNLQSLQSL